MCDARQEPAASSSSCCCGTDWLAAHLQARAPSVADCHGVLANSSCAVAPLAAAAGRAYIPWTASEKSVDTADVMMMMMKNQLGSRCAPN